MIDPYFSQSKVRRRLQSGPIGPFFPAFIATLDARGYAGDSIRRMIRTAGIPTPKAKNRTHDFRIDPGSPARPCCRYFPWLTHHWSERDRHSENNSECAATKPPPLLLFAARLGIFRDSEFREISVTKTVSH
jgi:hypothetical protein